MKLPMKLYTEISLNIGMNLSSNSEAPRSISKALSAMSINEVSHDKSNANHVIPTETEKIDRIPQAIEEMKVENNSTKVIALTAHIDTINHDYEEILDSLNLEGEKHGGQFKRGKTHYYDDAKVKYKAIVCKYKNLHAAKNKTNRQKKPDSLQNNSEISEPVPKIQESNTEKKGDVKSGCDCEVRYRFKYDQKDQKKFQLANFTENHALHDFRI